MSRRMKKMISALMCICMCAALCCLIPVRASADFEITKVLSTAVPTPVALMDVRNIPAATSTQGCYIAGYNWYDSKGNVASGTFGTGTYRIVITIGTQDGYVFSPDVAVYLNNGRADFSLDSSMRTLTLYRDYVPEIYAPTIFKHPGNETVDEGGEASFVVSSDYTTEYTWMMYPPNDDNVSYDVIDMRTMFPGLETEPQGRNKMNLYNVPAELDGWRIRCFFQYPGGSKASNFAKLTVRHTEKPVEETPAPAAAEVNQTPAETPAPTLTPTPEVIEEKVQEHTHDFGTVWHSDGVSHWKECECGEAAEKAEHSMTWTVFSAATRKAPGTERGICSVCSHTEEREIPYEPSAKDVLGIMGYVLYGVGIMIVIVIILMIITAIRDSARRRRRRKKRRKKKY